MGMVTSLIVLERKVTVMTMDELKKGDKVVVNDPGLLQMMALVPNMPPNNQGWVEDPDYSGDVLVKFPIGDDDPEEHSQVAPYPRAMVIKKEW
jgi:hypothetical protein